MADIADQSDDNIERERQAAIAKARSGLFPRITPSGFCAWCGDPVAAGRTHCRPLDNDCESVHLRYIRFRKGDV